MSEDASKSMPLSGASFGMTTMRGIMTLRAPLPDKHPLYEKIGRVAALWAELEHILDQMIWDLAKGEPPAISCITGQIMGSSGRFRAIKALCELRNMPQNLADQIKKLDQPILATSLKRNRILHDAWYHETTADQPDTQGQFRSQIYKDHDFGYEPISDEEIENAIQTINKHIDALRPLRNALIEALS